MALICNVDLENGLSIEDAYLKITNFDGTETNVNFILKIYASKNAYEEDKPAVSTTSHSMDFDTTSNLFRQMYEHLRTLSQYINAVEA